MPEFGYAGLPEPTTALTKPQMRNYYCRFFLRVAVFAQLPLRMAIPIFKTPVETITSPNDFVIHIAIIHNFVRFYKRKFPFKAEQLSHHSVKQPPIRPLQAIPSATEHEN